MQFSNTTTQSGLIQDCEFLTNLGKGTISTDADLLARFTMLINAGYDEVLPIVLQSDSKWQWDDSNQLDRPIATTDLKSGQADYSFISDNSGNSVLSILAAFIKGPDGIFRKLQAVDAGSDPHTSAIFAQNADNTGIPTRYDKYDTSLVLDPVPNYAATGGLKVLFLRTPSYFATTDTTKSPGIPSPFHRMLSLTASRDWLAVNKPENVTLLNTINAKLTEQKVQLALHMSKRAGDERTVMRSRRESFR